MKEFKDKVALITGAANGFGFEFAKEAARREMKGLLVDIEGEELEAARKICQEMGMETIALRADVSDPVQVEQCVNQAIAKFGGVDLLINNAGVAILGNCWELPLNDWEWAFHLNVFSQVYFMRLVIPMMMKQGTPCHILNVASVAGVITAPGMPAYHASKFASVALTESVYYDLQKLGAEIKMSVFCPGFVRTDLYRCERHRPERYKDPEDPYYASLAFHANQKHGEFLIKTGMAIDSIGMSVFQALEDESFYILTDPRYTMLIGTRAKNILEGGVPDVRNFIR